MNESEDTDSKSLFTYAQSKIHPDHVNDEPGGTVLRDAKDEDTSTNAILFENELKEVPRDLPMTAATNIAASTNLLWSGTNGIDISLVSALEETVADINGTSQSLEEYKCPICLDTFINTVKVDCSYGHKFCNFCIQCWINFERHVVTECPVCRGLIFGKSLDLKTDAEIRAIYDSLSEEEKRIRLISIKERLQLEYPNSNLNPHQYSSGLQVPVVSDVTHHQFNHALHLPIPLLNGTDNGAIQFTPSSSYLPGVQGFGESSGLQPVWSQGMFYPGSTWHCVHPPDFSNIGSIQLPQRTDHAGIQHQHYHHQNQENSRWDNNLYVIPEDSTTYNGWSTNGNHPQLLDQMNCGQGQRHDEFLQSIPSGADFQVGNGALNCNPEHRPTLLSPRCAAANHRHFLQQTHQTALPPNSPVTPVITTQPIQSHVNRFYCCYVPTCHGHIHHYCSSPTAATQFIAQSPNLLHRPHQQAVYSGCHGCHQNIPCHNISEVNRDTGNMETFTRSTIPRIRPNIPGTGSTTIQLPRPNNVISNSIPGPCVVRPTTQQMVSRCPVSNTRPHFSGGFSVFSSGYVRFHISHMYLQQ